ncbi:MAG: VpsF family polysaccharide biosynthesis protein [Shinella zoogloeoides]|uniref:VpsF family polysaccharide biosynthesis protein n=1 Tax=Shinella zoogloeoides TaxID=352475 RepID=UPI003C70F7F2
MAYPMVAIRPERGRIDLRSNALGILFLFLTVATLATRQLVTPDLMNMLTSYSSEGGPFYEKFHLATYATVALLLAILWSRPLALADRDVALFRSLVRYAAVMGGLAAYFVLIGRFSAIGFLVETYLAAVLAAILLLVQNEQARRIAATAMLSVLIASAIVAIGEVILQRRLMPFTEGEPVFRATGLSSHPLVLGAQCALAIGFVPLTRWPLWLKIVALFVLFIGCVAASARVALMASTLEILALILFLRWPNFPPRRELQAKLIVLFFTLVLGAALAVLLLSVGLLSRFSSVVDTNSMARVQIYEVFHYVSWKELLLGMNAADLLKIVNEQVGLEFIESAPVFIIMLMGLPMAIVFAIILIGYFLRILRGTELAARIGAVIFLLIDMTNNALATKTVDILLLTVLVVGLRKATQAAPASATTRQPAARATTSYRSLPAGRSG